jgi:hypothetical protein
MSVVRFTDYGSSFQRDPTDESVGYYQSSASRTLNEHDILRKKFFQKV